MDICCWWCCHPFDKEALHLPYKYDRVIKKFKTMGYFCSWGCMKAYNLKEIVHSKSGSISVNILLMRKQLCAVSTPIAPAPSRYILKMFGGKYTIDQFRNWSEIKTQPLVYLPTDPQNFTDVRVVEQTFDKPVSHKELTEKQAKSRLHDISSSMTATEPLKLKRNKPLKRSMANLESIIGITRG